MTKLYRSEFRCTSFLVRNLALLMGALMLVGCATTPWYDNPPRTPEPISPAENASLGSIAKVQFTWNATDETESYEFHIFNATNSDIQTYMLKDLRPDKVCQGQICGITLSLSLPESNRHAWRVRSTNIAGASTWTRRVFSWAPGL